MFVSPLIVLASIICTIGTLGNGLVIYVFAWRQQCKKRTERLLLLLGIADFICSISVPPLMIYSFSFFTTSGAFISMCQVIPEILVSNVTFSQCILILISYDRYKSIVMPLQQPITNRTIIIWLVASILVSIAMTVPLAIILRYGKTPTDMLCLLEAQRPMAKLGHSLLFLSRDMLALAITGFFIRRMIRALEKSVHFSTERTASCLKQYRRTKTILVMVAIVNSICIVPLDFFKVVVFSMASNSQMIRLGSDTMVQLFSFLQLLQVANSVFNVFIYSIIHSDFKTVRQMVKRYCLPCLRRKEKQVLIFGLGGRGSIRGDIQLASRTPEKHSDVSETGLSNDIEVSQSSKGID